MSYSSGIENSPPVAIRRPDPFALLPDHDTRRGRGWLFNLLMSPFKDDDERVTYRLAGKVSDATNRAGIRLAKAWNTSGAPVADPPRTVEFSSVAPLAAGR